MRLEELEVLSYGREDIIVFCLFLGVLGDMQDVGFLISQNLIRTGDYRDLSPSCLRLSIFGDSRD